MPTSGAAVILDLIASGDNPDTATHEIDYKRIRFEKILYNTADWVEIGGTLDDVGLLTASGSRYNFSATSPTYKVVVEISGFNRANAPGYVAYNSPTGAGSNGRKNPGFDLNASSIRVEIDDVKIIVTDPATTGYAAPTSPAQLLRNGDFSSGEANWTVFEGAEVNSTDQWNEDSGNANSGSGAFMIIPGWKGSPYAGFMQNQITFDPINGDYFTASFRAKFDANYKSDSTVVAFMDAGATTELYNADLAEEISQNLGQWHTYRASFKASASQMTTLNGKMTLKLQPIGRTVAGVEFSSALIDNVVLGQATSASIGPQISVKLNAVPQIDDGNTKLISPPIGRTASYSLKLENTGAENLIISSITLSGTSFALASTSLPATITPGATQTFSITTTPASIASIASTLTINSNDKEVADQAFVVNLSSTPVNLTESFNGTETPAALGWSITASTEGLLNASAVTATSGTLKLNVNSSADDYPWSYSISKTFTSPGPLDLSGSSLLVALKASGILAGSGNNKIQIRLESLNNAQAITGSIQLGAWVDETTANSIPNGSTYRTADGINDRIVVYVPENSGSYTTVGGSLSSPSTGVNTAFDTNAPYYRVVIQMTDREFDVDAGNLVTIDAITLDLKLKPFTLANASFEDDTTNVAEGLAPASWMQLPLLKVSKDIIANGTKIYNQSTGKEDSVIASSAFSGSKVMKVYAQNSYDTSGLVWLGPVQTGTVYQEFLTSGASTLASGAVIHARGMAKVFSIDPLNGGSAFNYGFKFLNSANSEISRTVTSLTANNFTPDKWLPLTVNATIPVGTEKVELISEFVQSASADKGSVYLDDLSIGFGTIDATTTVSGSTYSLVWSDEFDGSSLNSANWTPEILPAYSFNNEQQAYTSDPQNLRVDSGNLVIQAVKSGNAWTSARIKSQDKRKFQYGKIEFRAKLPTGVGPWPAAWLLGNNIQSTPWPACGEIDVMEWRGGFNGVATSDANTVGHALHSATRNSGNPVEAPRSAVSNPSSQFHTYAVVWTSSGMTFIVDGVNKATLTPPTADVAAFQKEFFIILNLAMGGGYLGTINTISPSVTSATYEVDYVRVYQDATVTTPTPSAPATPTFSSISSTGFTVNWAAVIGATSYKLDVSTSSTFGAGTYLSQAQDLTVSGTSQAITGLTPSTTYYARVRAVNAGGTSVSSPYGTLTSYQQYLSGLGISTTTAFNADANGDGVKEGIKYAFNAASPQLNSSPATITRTGTTLTYTFDIRDDSALTVVAQLSTNLTSWADQAGSVISNGTGAPTGYIRKIVTITTTEPKAFIRLQVTGN
jgi:beta-glucanase (GH16 family)